MTRLKSTSAARDLVKAHEPFRAVAERGADGRWVIGWGHRAGAREGAQIRPEDAELLLVYDVLQAEQAIDAALDTEPGVPQRDALVSFALGVGFDAFRQSAVVRLIDRGRWRDAADAIAAWGGGQSPRRAAERARFLVDLPADAPRAPVELVIEFEHPEMDAPGLETDAAPPVEAAPEETPASPERAEDEAGAASLSEDADAAAAPAPAAQARSAAAERVLARMRSQMHIPVEPEAAPETASETTSEAPEPEAAETLQPEEDEAPPEPAKPVSGRMGYVFDTAAVTARPIFPSEPEPEPDPESEPEPEPASKAEPDPESDSEPQRDVETAAADPKPEPEPEPAAEAPPITTGSPAEAEGLSGEAGADASVPANDIDAEVEYEPHPEDLEGDMPDPEDIDGDFSREFAPAARGLNGFSNGDDSAAPQSGGGWGVPSVFIAGTVVAAAGVWETFVNFDQYLATETFWPGPVAVIAGALLAAGAGVTMAGGALARAGSRRR